MRGSRPCLWLAALVLATTLARAESVLDLHGPDGLPYSLDDPLRVGAAVHNGVFFLSYNGVYPDKILDTCRSDDRTELCFLNFNRQTVSRLPVNFTDTNAVGPAWEDPLKIDNEPPNFNGSENADFYGTGVALRHSIVGGTKSVPAVRIDPSWIQGLPSNFFVSIKEISFSDIFIDKGQAIAAIRLGDQPQDALSGSFRLRVGTVWVRVKILFAEVTIELPASRINNYTDVPQDIRDTVNQKISSDATLSTLGITGDAVIQAALTGGGNCTNVKPGITAGSPECTAINDLIAQTRETLDSISVEGAGMVQDTLDTMCRYVDSPQTYNWLDWRDPWAGSGGNSELVNRVIKVRMKTAWDDLMGSGGASGRPVHSGGYFFNSLYLYGPKGKYIIEKDGTPGLVEDYVYNRINRINPFSSGGGQADWKQVDFITAKVNPCPPPSVPWPPADPDGQGRVEEAFGAGTCQITGDEAANGDAGAPNDPPLPPDQVSQMLMLVRPDKEALRLAYYVRTVALRGGATGGETPWVPLPIDEAPPPLPKDYNFPSTRPGGKEVRNFNASVINKNYAASQGLNYNWDLNCDGKIDSVYAHTTRMIDPGGGLAICYVLDPVSNKTGVGLVEIAKLGQ